MCSQSLSALWTNYVGALLSSPDVHIAYQAPTIRTGQRGCAMFHVTYDQLEYLSPLSFSWTKIAQLLGILGFRVTRDRVHTAIRSTDPLNTALRRLTGRISLTAIQCARTK